MFQHACINMHALNWNASASLRLRFWKNMTRSWWRGRRSTTESYWSGSLISSRLPESMLQTPGLNTCSLLWCSIQLGSKKQRRYTHRGTYCSAAIVFTFLSPGRVRLQIMDGMGISGTAWQVSLAWWSAVAAFCDSVPSDERFLKEHCADRGACIDRCLLLWTPQPYSPA